MFAQIPGFSDYLIDETGKVISLCFKRGGVRQYRWKELVPQERHGYLIVNLYQNSKMYSKSVHRLVMSAFIGVSTQQVNHKNGIKSDNRLDNLEYCSAQENVKHAWHTGLNTTEGRDTLLTSKRIQGQNNPKALLTECEAVQLLKLRTTVSKNEAAKRFDVPLRVVTRLWNRETWKHLGK